MRPLTFGMGIVCTNCKGAALCAFASTGKPIRKPASKPTNKQYVFIAPLSTSSDSEYSKNRTPSPDQFHRELNLPGGCLRRRDQPGIADWASRRIKDVPIVQRRSEIRMIDNVEKFRAELRIKRVRDSLDVIVFEQRKIEIHQSRTDDGVAAQIPAKRNGIRHGKTLSRSEER